MELYGHHFSSYTWKALIPLYAYDLDFEFRAVDPDHPENHAFVQKAHPAGKFPVLVDSGKVIVEATAIIEHLTATKPQAAGLIPADPSAAAVTRMIDRIFDNYVMGNMQRVVLADMANAENPDDVEIDAANEDLRRVYLWLENWLEAHALPPHISLVSCAAAPSLFYADWVEPISLQCPRLAGLRAELLAHPAVSRCVEDARPFRYFFPPGAPDRD